MRERSISIPEHLLLNSVLGRGDDLWGFWKPLPPNNVNRIEVEKETMIAEPAHSALTVSLLSSDHFESHFM